MIALGARILIAYGTVAITTGFLCASVPATAGAQAAAQAVTAARSWPSENPPRPWASKPVKFPPYEIRKLANGLQVVLVNHHEQPAVSVRMLIRAGAAQDPKGKMGLAMLTASVLDQGAGKRTAEQIADAIDFVGGILGTGAGTDLTYVNAVVMKDSYPVALDLIADVVRRPTFAAAEVERQRQQALSGLKVAAEDPDNVASQVIDRLIYGFHPYGLPGSGTPQSLAALTRDDVVEFHRQFFAPNNALLAIVGDIAKEEAMAGVERAFGDWKAQDVAVFKPIDPPPPTRRVVVIDKADAVQTEIRVGQLGIARRHDDYMAMDQAVKILGGEGANRLQQVLRSQRGLTYGASADLETFKTAGGIVAETDTRTAATAEVLRVTVDEFFKLQRERIHDGELEGAQAYLAGHFPLTIETPDAIATQVLNQLFYELPLEELQTFPERVRNVTPDEVQRVARLYFRPDRLSVVLVGNAEAFAKDLRGVGFGEFERIPIDQVDLLSADLRKGGARVGFFPPRAGTKDTKGAKDTKTIAWLGSRALRFQETSSQAAAKPSAIEEEQIAAILRRVIDAHGGRDALLGVKRLIADSSTTVVTPNGKVAAETRTFIEYPQRVRVEARVSGDELLQLYVDGKGWIKDPSGVHDAPPPMLEALRAATLRDPLALLRGAAANRLKIRLDPDEGHQGKVLKVLSIHGIDADPVRLYVDGQTGALVKIRYSARGGPGTATPAEEVFEDFRKVDGVSIPFKASIIRNDVVVLERTLTDVKINPPLAPDTFIKPAR